MRVVPFLLFCAEPAPASAALTTEAPEADDVSTYVATVGEKDRCHGKQISYESCVETNCKTCTPVACELGDWNGWSACLCEGLKERNRVIVTHNNECGAPCKDNLIETENCEIDCLKVPKNCTMGSWSEWSVCKGDMYQMTRTRKYSDPENGGYGCANCTSEVQPCPNPPAPEDKDCAWGEWSDYSACTCSCDGGQKTRDRSVLEAPRGKGRHCDPLAKTEVSPCNTQKCGDGCIDAKWGDWSKWDACTAPKCGGGTQWKLRSIVVQADECGAPALGFSTKVQPCNTQPCDDDIDCKFGEWGHWSDCSCTCEGIQHRSRTIAKYGLAGGEFCAGGTKEVEACNNYTSNPKCRADPPVDCEWNEWELGKCTTTCGGGQLMSERSIKTPHAFGGKPCNGTMTKTEACHTESCTSQPPVDCKWNAWSEWSVCDKCGGQRKRSRTIGQMPQHMGQACHFEYSEETMKCPRECHKKVYCVWSEWTVDPKCSAECGKGFRKKERDLKETTTPPAGAPQTLFDKGEIMPESRLQDLAISFSCGALVTFLVLVVTMRVFRRENRDWNHIRRDPEQSHLVDMRAAE